MADEKPNKDTIIVTRAGNGYYHLYLDNAHYTFYALKFFAKRKARKLAKRMGYVHVPVDSPGTVVITESGQALVVEDVWADPKKRDLTNVLG